MAATTAPSQMVTGRVTDSQGEPLEGAVVRWIDGSQAVATGPEGDFSIEATRFPARLVTSYTGAMADTLSVDAFPSAPLDITLLDYTLDEVTVTARRRGLTNLAGAVNGFNINQAELFRAACCNLGESFVTNPSVDVSYNDAATGAKQIKLLGLSGAYVQMLTENLPNYRGPAAPYALGYVPGTWMKSIQVSKGSASVKNGYESLTGQINIEFLKPQDEEQLNVNLYGDTQAKFEANLDGNIHINDRLSTGLLLHYQDAYKNHDMNDDGFIDSPDVRQFHAMNRWAYFSPRYIFQGGFSILDEKRSSGEVGHSHSGHVAESSHPLYTIGIDTRRYQLFAKNAVVVDQATNSNVALMATGSIHDQDSRYGLRVYDVMQHNLYASLMYEGEFGQHHSLSAGLSLNADRLRQRLRMTHDAAAATLPFTDSETTPGAYAQYTYNLNDKLIVMGGLRWDHSSIYGSFLTPRAHVKWMPVEGLSLRASAGKGSRTVYPYAEFSYLLAGGRKLVVDADLDREEAVNYGLSASYVFPLFNRNFSVNAEYFYTRFPHQVIADRDSDPSTVHITSLNGKSYSHTLQVEATYEVISGLTATAAYRYNDVRATYGGKLMTVPLTNRYKALLTASYKTPLELWQFDATVQLNGPGRMPTPATGADGAPLWEGRFKAFAQLSAQVTRWFRHWSVYIGGENLTGFRQKRTIIGADDPWGTTFDPTMVWGPVHGPMVYVGFRFNLTKY